MSAEASKDSYSIKGRLFSSVETWDVLLNAENNSISLKILPEIIVTHQYFTLSFSSPSPLKPLQNLYSQRILSVEDCLK